MIEKIAPQGLEDLYGYEYELKEEIINRIKGIFRLYGYHPIITPTLEYYSLYSNIENPLSTIDMFKLIDKDGRILVLRPDSTIPVARIVVSNYRSNFKHQKFFYISNIFRLNTLEGEKREFLQGGIEFIGNNKPDCDGEVISIAIKSLLGCGIRDFHIDLGHVGFIEGLINEMDFEQYQKNKIYKMIESKNYYDLKALLREIDLDKVHMEALLKIPKLYGNPEKVILNGKQLTLNKSMEEALNNLENVYSILKDYGFEKYVNFDLGFTKKLGYYTGMIFKGYVNPLGREIITGGRYDNLIKGFGGNIPACGFGININRLVEVIDLFKDNRSIGSCTDYLVLYKDVFRGKAIYLSERLRERGFVVESDSYNSSIKEYLQQKTKNIKEIIEIDDEYVKIVNINRNDIKRISISQFLERLDGDNFIVPIH